MARPTREASGVKAAALGLRAHSGWAAAIVLAGPAAAPSVIDRRRIEMTDPTVPGCAQPYHAAEGLEGGEARRLIERCQRSAASLATEGLLPLLLAARESGHEVVGAGILTASGRTLPGLAAILASHALIHAAEGEHFRDALAAALASLHVPALRRPEREVLADTARERGVPGEQLQKRLGALGRTLGPPWTRDQKSAALIAWLVLGGRSRA